MVHIAGCSGQDFGVLEFDVMFMTESGLCTTDLLHKVDRLLMYFHVNISGLANPYSPVIIQN
jgi:hypothetical protein